MSYVDFGIHRFWKYSAFLQFLRCSFPRSNTLEQKGNINNYSVYPDNSIRIFECLDNVRMISKLLSSNGVIIDEISVQGENLETYFENLIGGRKNV